MNNVWWENRLYCEICLIKMQTGFSDRWGTFNWYWGSKKVLMEGIILNLSPDLNVEEWVAISLVESIERHLDREKRRWKDMCTRTWCHPETERFMRPRACEAMVKVKTLGTTEGRTWRDFCALLNSLNFLLKAWRSI